MGNLLIISGFVAAFSIALVLLNIAARKERASGDRGGFRRNRQQP